MWFVVYICRALYEKDIEKKEEKKGKEGRKTFAVLFFQ